MPFGGDRGCPRGEGWSQPAAEARHCGNSGTRAGPLGAPRGTLLSALSPCVLEPELRPASKPAFQTRRQPARTATRSWDGRGDEVSRRSVPSAAFAGLLAAAERRPPRLWAASRTALPLPVSLGAAGWGLRPQRSVLSGPEAGSPGSGQFGFRGGLSSWHAGGHLLLVSLHGRPSEVGASLPGAQWGPEEPV